MEENDIKLKYCLLDSFTEKVCSFVSIVNKYEHSNQQNTSNILIIMIKPAEYAVINLWAELFFNC